MSLQVAPKQIGPRSLQRMCLAVALRNIASITDVGELPFATAKPLLKHIENPVQLHQLEVNCPQLAAEHEQMGLIWSRLINRKFPKWDEKGYPVDDDMSWFDIYSVVKESVDRDNAAATAQLQQKLAGFNRAREGNTMQIVSSRALSKAQPNVRRRVPGGSMPSFTFGGGTRTRMTSGQSVLRRARREAAEISKVSALSTPTGNLRVAQGQIRKAPEAMVHEHRVSHNPEIVIRPPKKRPLDLSAGAGAANMANEARLLALKTGSAPSDPAIDVSEARLRALKTGQTAAPSQTVRPPKRRPAIPVVHRPADADSDEDQDWDNVDDDDLFGDAPRKKPRLTVQDLESGTGGSRSSRGERPATKAPPARSQRPEATAAPTPQRRVRPSVEADLSPAPRRQHPPARDAPSRPAPKPLKMSDADASSPRKPPARRSPGPAPPVRKKAVDIFMRPKKR